MCVNCRGFTLLELLVTITLLATLAAISLPRLMSAHPDATLERQADDLQSLLIHARRLAMQRRQRVFVCGAVVTDVGEDGASAPCMDQPLWPHGISVLADSSGDGAPTAGDRSLMYEASMAAPAKLRWRGFHGKNQITFLSSCTTHWQNGRLSLCLPGAVVRQRDIVLNTAGRSYLLRPIVSACE